MTRRFGTSPQVHAACAAIVAFVIYFITRVPGLYYTDSGELAAACSTLGIAHPTGYPLFTLLGNVWLTLPWTSHIDGLNVLAGVWTSAAVGMLVLVLLQVFALVKPTTSKGSAPTMPIGVLLLADACALLFAFSGTVWAQGTSIEVYSLQLLLTVLMLWCTLKSIREQEGRVMWTGLASLMMGLMLANHVSSIFLAPGLLVMWYMGVGNKKSAVALLPYLLGPAILAVCLYAYLPLRSAQLPPINWGMVHRDMAAFLYHVKGTQFSVWLFSDGEGTSQNTALAAKLFVSSVLFVGVIPVVYGIVELFKRSRAVSVGLALVFLGNVIISVGYNIPDIDNYFLPMLLVTNIWFALGLYAMFASFVQRPAFGAAFLALPIIALIIGMSAQDRSKHVAVEAYTRWTLANAQPGAIILSRQWDYLCSAMWYLQTVEHEREDIVLIEKELLRRTWYVPYLQYRYPKVMAPVRNEADAYMQLLAQFEADGESFKKDPIRVQEIQQRFVALINAILTRNTDRPLYATVEIMHEEKGLAEGFTPYPVGPLLRLRPAQATSTADAAADTLAGGAKGQRATFQHTDELVTGLRGREERLDEGLRQTVRSILENNIRYANYTGDSAAVSQIRRIDAQLLRTSKRRR